MGLSATIFPAIKHLRPPQVERVNTVEMWLEKRQAKWTQKHCPLYGRFFLGNIAQTRLGRVFTSYAEAGALLPK